jgi:hypothetical protein
MNTEYSPGTVSHMTRTEWISPQWEQLNLQYCPNATSADIDQPAKSGPLIMACTVHYSVSKFPGKNDELKERQVHIKYKVWKGLTSLTGPFPFSQQLSWILKNSFKTYHSVHAANLQYFSNRCHWNQQYSTKSHVFIN